MTILYYTLIPQTWLIVAEISNNRKTIGFFFYRRSRERGHYTLGPEVCFVMTLCLSWTGIAHVWQTDYISNSMIYRMEIIFGNWSADVHVYYVQIAGNKSRVHNEEKGQRLIWITLTRLYEHKGKEIETRMVHGFARKYKVYMVIVTYDCIRFCTTTMQVCS